MATRAIVTSQPDVACDVCGRRLLRGEHPETYLAGGERRTVCELCAPRAVQEGWLRASEGHDDLSMRPARRRRGVSLLGRLRQLREPTRSVLASPEQLPEHIPEESRDWEAAMYGAQPVSADGAQPALADGARPVLADGVQPLSADGAQRVLADPPAEGEGAHVSEAVRALEIFNAGTQPRRVAGVMRSLGAPSVAVRHLAGARFMIVVAWELCWYRYEIDIDDELADARLIEKGMELEELADEDREANATADERGELALRV